jgi:hypothetical protein
VVVHNCRFERVARVCARNFLSAFDSRSAGNAPTHRCCSCCIALNTQDRRGAAITANAVATTKPDYGCFSATDACRNCSGGFNETRISEHERSRFKLSVCF